MKKRIIESLNLLYVFIRNPFEKPIDNLDDDKNLVFLASILSGFTVIIMTLNQTDVFFDPWQPVIYIVIGLLLTPLFGLLIVHFKGAIFHLYLKYLNTDTCNHTSALVGVLHQQAKGRFVIPKLHIT